MMTMAMVVIAEGRVNIGPEHRLWSHTACVEIQAPLFTSCVTEKNYLTFLAQFPQKMGIVLPFSEGWDY